MTFKVNHADCGCGCEGAGDCQPGLLTLRSNLSGGARHETFLGQDHLVVPLVMLRETVVNGGLVMLDELKPQSWNGVPVTIGHPQVGGSMVSANSPQVITEWRVGMIFNAKLDGDKLKAEAWICVKDAEAKYPGITPLLEGGDNMDVSTGYFSTDDAVSGVYNGMPFFEVHRDIKPDHLALLPEEEGACSWADGCGVRVNTKENGMSDKAKPDAVSEEELAGIARFFKTFQRQSKPKTQRRGEDDDFRQMVADLISKDESPFTPDDQYGLNDMSYDSVVALRDQYVPVAKEEQPSTNSKGADMSNKDQVTPLTADAVKDIVTNAVAEAMGESLTKAVDLAVNANHRKDLIAAINTNMGVDADELAKLSTEALEAMAPKADAAAKNNAKADMSGRGLKTQGDGSAAVTRFPGMSTNGKAAEAKKEA